MSRRPIVEAGMMLSTDVQLALYRYYVDATDEELQEFGIGRAEVLTIARSLEGDNEYRRSELASIADNIIRAYTAGRRWRVSSDQ